MIKKLLIQLTFVVIFTISSPSLSTGWILDISSFGTKQPSIQECIHAMKNGVMVLSRAVSETQPINNSYIFADKMYSTRWNQIDEMFVCYYDGELVDTNSIKGKKVIKNQLEFRRKANRPR